MTLAERFVSIRREAEALAGGVLEIPRRVLLLVDLYRGSGGNHTLPRMGRCGRSAISRPAAASGG